MKFTRDGEISMILRCRHVVDDWGPRGRRLHACWHHRTIIVGAVSGLVLDLCDGLVAFFRGTLCHIGALTDAHCGMREFVDVDGRQFFFWC